MVSPTMASVPPGRPTRLSAVTPPFRIFITCVEGDPLPVRGLMYSLALHFLFALTTFLVPWNYWMPSRAHLAIAQSVSPAHTVLLLPRLEPMGADGPAGRSKAGGEQNTLDESSTAKAIRGVVYSGPQLMVSNPTHPDNFVQTIRQPALPELPKLPSPLPLPPMVQVASAPSEVSRPVVPVLIAATQPARLSQQQAKIEPPKLPLAASSAADLPLGTARASVPTLAPKPVPPNQSGNQPKSLLVINAFSTSEAKPSAIPPGELHGAFTVSPVGTTSIGLAGGGTAQTGAPGLTSAAVSGTSAYAENGTSKSVGGVSKGTSVKPGIGAGTEGGRLGSAGARTLSAAGSGARLSGNGRGTGTAAGTGNSPFPLVMIQGGSAGGDGRGVTSAPTSAASNSRPGYGLTIIASGASGGGFRDFGVFRNEASYTVYVDMGDIGVRGSWTMQYALDTHHTLGAADPPQRAHGVLVPPYASIKAIPRYPQQPRHCSGTVVVSGVINPQGSFEQLRVMQSPDASLNQSLLDTLRTWVFHPAEVDGAKVAVKVLLGVPVSTLPE